MSKITNSLEVMTLKTFFSSNPIVFIFLLVNLSNLSTCFKDFSDFSQLYLAGTKSSNTGEICIRQTYINDAYIENILAYAGDVCIKGAGTKSTCIRDVYIRGIYSNDVCTRADICFGSACIGASTYSGDACIGSAGIDDASNMNTYAGRAYIGNGYTGST